jgi:uncharacterized membrane protein HdeD (DUF308 family)
VVAAKHASVLECGGPPPLFPLKLLKDNYLSFINKKYLTNGIDGCIHCAMNANENSPQVNPRLKRIQMVVRVIRAIIGLIVVFSAIVIPINLALFMGWIGYQSGIHVSFSHFHTYSWPFKIPAPVLALVLVRLGLFFAGAFVLNRLLRLYATGKFFTGQNVGYIKWLGWIVLSDWVVEKLLDAVENGFDPNPMKLVVGLLVILLAWIMDEGRKIQEEQELTV